MELNDDEHHKEDVFLMDKNDDLVVKTGNKDEHADYTDLIHRVEKELHCHIDSIHVHSVGDVIYAAKHYFHAKHQRQYSQFNLVRKV